jgi:hypothetical protein
MKRPVSADLLVNCRYALSRKPSGWGLAWYLASEICDRFYCSHGIGAAVIIRDGLGYYGLAIEQAECRMAKQQKLGRFSMSGDVENWRTGAPGDHGLPLAERASAGEPVDRMIVEAIRHLDLPLVPVHSHVHCRHKRWGISYQIVVRIAALMALRWEDRITIWSAPQSEARPIKDLDSKAEMSEHPGYFLIESPRSNLILCGDGRVLQPADHPSIWERYMCGQSIADLLNWAEGLLRLER